MLHVRMHNYHLYIVKQINTYKGHGEWMLYVHQIWYSTHESLEYILTCFCMYVVHVHTKRDIRTVMKYKQMRHITFCMVGNIGGELRTLGRSVSQPTKHAITKITVYIEINFLDH